MDPLSVFSPETRDWFERTFSAPTPAQALGWPAIARGGNTLIQAPTGSGKTLAAFLYGLDKLSGDAAEGVRLLYVSPLKALNYDVERNLRGPLAGLGSPLRVAVRTGDTPQKERAAMLREPPDILITTPESLFLLLTSRARETLGSVAVDLACVGAFIPHPLRRPGDHFRDDGSDMVLAFELNHTVIVAPVIAARRVLDRRPHKPVAHDVDSHLCRGLMIAFPILFRRV